MGEIRDNIQRGVNIGSAVVGSFASVIHPAFAAIPVFASVFNEVCNFWNEREAKEKDEKLLRAVEQKMTLEEFQGFVDSLDAHGRSVVRRDIRYLYLEAMPETTDVLIQALIHEICEKEPTMAEHICEILHDCNAEDIHFLKKILEYQKCGGCKEKNLHVQSVKQPKGNWVDREYIYGENTIFIQDFLDYYQLSVSDVSRMMMQFPEGDDSVSYACMMRALLKLSNLGIFQLEYLTTLGHMNPMNIDRFHITLFGQQLLGYLEASLE